MTTVTEFLDVEGGRIAYEVSGVGPLVVLCPGIADTRSTYRFLAPLIVEAGYRVATVDLRGHGESSTGWSSYSRTDTANDLIAVIETLGGPAVVVGQSFSGGSATIAAAVRPDLVSAIVEIDPFTRPPKFSAGSFFRDSRYRRGALLIGEFAMTGQIRIWAKYLTMAYPGQKPDDWTMWLDALKTNLREPGRTKAAKKMFLSKPVDAAAKLADVRCPALVVMGSADADFPDPEAEAKGIVADLANSAASFAMIEDAGHYPHAEYPQQVANVILPFFAANHLA